MYSKNRKESQIAIVGDRNDYYYDNELADSSEGSKEGSLHEEAVAHYNRGSTSSSSEGSGRNLVRPGEGFGHAARLDPVYDLHGERFFDRGGRPVLGALHSNPPGGTPFHTAHPHRFYIGAPSPTGRPSSAKISLPSNAMPNFATPIDSRKRSPANYLYNLQIHQNQLLTPAKVYDRKESMYDPYWHTEAPKGWRGFEECFNERCANCQLKDEVGSTCSSVNPPPTFTAMDNYRPVKRKRRKCSCGAISAATTAFSTLILILIVAFIVYTEMVLKKTSYVPEPM